VPVASNGFCDDAEAKKACEAEDRTATGIKSDDCFGKVLSGYLSVVECNPILFLANNARAQELFKKGDAGTEAEQTEYVYLAKDNTPAACKSALRCFGSSTLGAKQLVVTVTLPYASKEAFTPALQLEFRNALARVAGVPVEQVVIVSITAARRSGEAGDQATMRRLLQSGSLSVQTQVTTPSDPVKVDSWACE
jgi:hypothetical protein